MLLLFAQVGTLPQKRTAKSSRSVPASAEPQPSVAVEQKSSWQGLKMVANAWGVSLILHMILLIIAGLIILPEVVQQSGVITTISTEDSEQYSFDSNVGMDLSAEIEMLSAPELPTMTQTVLTPDSLETAVDDSLEDSLGALFGENQKEGGVKGGFAPPPGVKFFRKGSFTAWTVPEDPLPGQAYKIVMVVQLPERVARYRATDLSGKVVGSDTYTQAIPGREYTGKRVYLPIKDRTAQLVIEVPGGAAKVKDVIHIRSRVLRESQELQIEF